MTTVLAVCGSRRERSYTRLLLQTALAAAAADGAETDLLDLGSVDLPLYHPDLDEQGDSAAIVSRVREADGVLVGSPVYHGSYSSTFKNLHDYCSFDDYEETVVGLVAVAGGGSYGSTLDHLRATIRAVHGLVVPHEVGVRRASELFEGDDLVDDALRRRTERLGREVLDYARRL